MSIYIKRRKKLYSLMSCEKLSYYLETKEINSYYLTGFKGNSYPILCSSSKIYLFLPPMLYTQFINSGLNGKDIILIEVKAALVQDFKSLIKKNKIKRIGLNPNTALTRWHIFLKNLTKCILIKGFVERLRLIKDEEELKTIKKACCITSELNRKLTKIYKQKDSEKILASKIDSFFLERKSTPAFDTIVAYGENSQFPHHLPGNKKRRIDNIMLLDCGAKYNYYCSDLTRVFFLDRIKKSKKILTDLYKIVKETKEILIDSLKLGVNLADIDKKARDLVKKQGFSEYYLHGTGHGLGLEIHEEPYINRYSKDIARENMVVTIEPGVYIPNIGGIRLEDTVLITKKGAQVIVTP